MKETILLIEDEVELQQNLKEILEFNGFTVFTADNGQEALLIIAEQQIDLFLCDVMMPLVGGFQFLKIIRNHEKYHYTPFIFLSAKASNDDKVKGKLEGSDDYLTKPIPARVLLNSIMKVLNGRKEDEILSDNKRASSREEDFLSLINELQTEANHLRGILKLLKESGHSNDLKENSRLIDLAIASGNEIDTSCTKINLIHQDTR